MVIGVIYGELFEGAGKDEEDNLIEVDLVTGVLRTSGYTPVGIPVSTDLKKTATLLKELLPLFAFNLVDSIEGTGRLIHLAPSLLEHLKYCEEKIEGTGGGRLYIETSSKEKYEPTRLFYDRYGYKVAGLLEDFYDDGDDKIFYCKLIRKTCNIKYSVFHNLA